jgi:hypothetical protein
VSTGEVVVRPVRIGDAQSLLRRRAGTIHSLWHGRSARHARLAA